MKWKHFLNKPQKDTFVPGDWNAIDDRFGRKAKASTMSRQWDGFMTANPEKRHEQDFLRSRPERIRTPWNRPEPDDVFVN